MSREIKLRMWSNSQNKYVDGTFITVSTEGSLYSLDEAYIFEQYTGLKDKNGKEIYEGDIVQDSKGVKCRVEWNTGEAHFGLYVGKQMELTDFIWMRGEDLEVIGTIHENPELLGGEE